MTVSVKVKAIHISRMPGIHSPGFKLDDLSPGVNILYGPNGSGKTSVGRATILALFGGSKSLWKRLAPGLDDEVSRDLGQLQFEVAFVADGADGVARDWQVSINSGSFHTLIDGDPGTLSAGSPELAQRYRMGLAELLVESNEEFVREMLRQAAGGIDFAGIIKQLKWDAPVSKWRNRPDQDVQRARSELKTAEAAQAQLERNGVGVAKLQAEAEKLRKKQKLERQIKVAIAHLDEQEEVGKLQETINEIPESVRQISSTAHDEATLLVEKLRIAADARKNAKTDLERHRNLAVPLNANEITAKDVHLATAKALCDELQKVEQVLDIARSEQQRANGRLIAVETTISGGKPPGWATYGSGDDGLVAHADELAARVHAMRAQHQGYKELQRQFDASEWIRGIRKDGLPSREVARRLLDTLTDWCKASDPPTASAPAKSAPESSLPWWLVWAVLVALLFSSLVLTASGQYAGAIGVPAVALAAWRVWRDQRLKSTGSATTSPLVGLQIKFKKLASDAGIAIPQKWTTDAVGERIDELIGCLVNHERLEVETHLSAKLSELKREADGVKSDVVQRCEDFENRHGIALSTNDSLPTEVAMPLMVRNIADWRHATNELNAADSTHNDVQHEVDDQRNQLRQALEAVGLVINGSDTLITFALANRHLASLGDRRSEFNRNAQLELELDKKLKLAIVEHDSANEKTTEHWNSIGLNPGDFGKLQSLLEENKEFKQLEDKLQNAQSRALEGERQLAKFGENLDLLDRTTDELTRELESLEGLDDEISGIDRQIGNVVGQVNRAAKGHDICQRKLALQAANEALFHRERERAAIAIREQVVAWVRDSMHQDVVTPVVERAKRLLASFTRGGLEFQVRADDPPVLLARARKSEAWRTVERLSAGERIQLLMAIRLAFLEESEAQMLPIFLDEVLGSSDDERARNIIDAAIAIANTGRQVFYATAQADEVAKWQARLETCPLPNRIIKLAEARNLQQAQAFPFPESLPEPRILPTPDRLSHAEYGQLLGIPGIDWSEPGLGSLHLWHVIEDTALLHDVLRQGLTTVDQVERVAAHEDDGPIAEAGDTMRAAVCAYRAAAGAWQVGRGKPITRAVIDDAEGVTVAFREQIWEIARQSNGDARELMQKLKTTPPARWRQTYTEALERWLQSNDYLIEEEPVDIKEIVTRVYEELAAKRLLNDKVTQVTMPRLQAMLDSVQLPPRTTLGK
ncbi:MAG: hypothetical protein RIR77_1448 [Planctomycetota bacterium]|jgi:DNA repair exonuclease SbcCD ATPase subunit